MAAAPWTFRIEARDGYLYIHQEGTFETEADVRAFHRAIEEAATNAGTTRALFDNRKTDPAPEDLRAVMWTWFTKTTALQRSAAIINSPRVSRRADKTAERNRVRVRTFDNEGDALAWLLDGS
ncbi:MAG: STAS/SEC14 domain-containing protein [Myxococcota bacterium]